MLCNVRDAAKADITPYTTPLRGPHSATLGSRQPEPPPWLPPCHERETPVPSLAAIGAACRRRAAPARIVRRRRGERRAGRPGLRPGSGRARGPAVPGRALERGADRGRAGSGRDGERRHRLCGLLRRDARAAGTLHHAASQAPYRLALERARALKPPASAMPLRHAHIRPAASLLPLWGGPTRPKAEREGGRRA